MFMEELILLRFPYYPKRSTGSMQSLSESQEFFAELEKFTLKLMESQGTPNIQKF